MMKVGKMEIPSEIIDMAKVLVLENALKDGADEQVAKTMSKEIAKKSINEFKDAVCAVVACVNADGNSCFVARGNADAIAVLMHDVYQKLEESLDHPLESIILDSAKKLQGKSECNCPKCKAERAARECKKSQ